MRYVDAMHQVRQRTQPDPDALARVRARLDLHLVPATAELSLLPGATPEGLARVRARLARRPARRPVGWVLAGSSLTLAAAMAATALVIGQPGPQPIERPLAQEATPLQLGPHVVATSEGQGHVTGTSRDLSIAWEAGRLELDVVPDEGVTLTVHTPEGTVRVTGTQLVVVRDALGTSVEVLDGSAELSCDAGPDAPLLQGEQHLCPPTTAAGLLARGRALQASGAPSEAILGVLDQGLILATPGPVQGELLAARIGPLIDQGRPAEALASAEEALQLEVPRASALRRFAAGLRLRDGDCAGALIHLEAIEDRTPEEEAHLQRCRLEP